MSGIIGGQPQRWYGWNLGSAVKGHRSGLCLSWPDLSGHRLLGLCVGRLGLGRKKGSFSSLQGNTLYSETELIAWGPLGLLGCASLAFWGLTQGASRSLCQYLQKYSYSQKINCSPPLPRPAVAFPTLLLRET